VVYREIRENTAEYEQAHKRYAAQEDGVEIGRNRLGYWALHLIPEKGSPQGKTQDTPVRSARTGFGHRPTGVLEYSVLVRAFAQ
jgi:hypothetical protein